MTRDFEIERLYIESNRFAMSSSYMTIKWNEFALTLLCNVSHLSLDVDTSLIETLSCMYSVCLRAALSLHCISHKFAMIHWVVNIGYIFGAGGSFNKRRWTNYSWLQTNGLWNCKTNGNLSTCIHRLSIQICIICIYARNKNHLT